MYDLKLKVVDLFKISSVLSATSDCCLRIAAETEKVGVLKVEEGRWWHLMGMNEEDEGKMEHDD